MDFDKFKGEIVPLFEKKLASQIAKVSKTDMEESMQYSLLAPGKRLRPLLLLATTAAYQPDFLEKAYPAAMALEMVHTYSLIHDDLPAMDDDDLRRGRPTNHVQFDEATAILAGDALLTLAFEVLASPTAELSPSLQIQLVYRLAQAAGYQGMIAGQKEDIESEGKDVSLDHVMMIHRLKTGALFQFAVQAGALIAGASDGDIEKLGHWAMQLGLAFQIRDDLLDIVGSEEELGKATHADEHLAKATYPALLGVNGAYERLEQELQDCHDLLTEMEDGRADFSVLKSLTNRLRMDEYFK